MKRIFISNQAPYKQFTLIVLSLIIFFSKLEAQNHPVNVSAPIPASTIFIPPNYNSGIFINKFIIYTPKTRITNSADINSASTYEVNKEIVCQDGLGRKIQVIEKEATPQRKDLIKPYFYDDFGNQTYDFLPYANTQNSIQGGFNLNAFSSQNSFYNNLNPEESVFYSRKISDYSSTDNLTWTMKPGNTWAGNSLGESSHLETNVVNEVRDWTCYYGAPYTAGTYSELELLVQESTNEEDKRVRKYYDKENKLVMMKVESGDPTSGPILVPPSPTSYIGWNTTFYVYDELNRLRFIISPKATSYLSNNGWSLSTAMTNALCTQYVYDSKSRLIMKKLPGQLETFIVYDIQNRAVLIQTGNMHSSNQWMFNKYDGFNRVILTGMFNNSNAMTQAQLSQEMENNSSISGSFLSFLQQPEIDNTYTSTSSIPDADIYSINYFDKYNSSLTGYAFDPAISSSMPGIGLPEPHSPTKETFSKNTGNYSRVMNGNTPTNTWMSKVNYFDNLGRVLQSRGANQSGGIDIQTNVFDYFGQVVSTQATIENPNSTNIPIVNNLKYYVRDNNGYLFRTLCKVNNEPNYRRLNNIYFDQLGRISRKQLGFIVETQNYKYRAWGALASINVDYCNTGIGDNFFGEIISTDYGFNYPKYDGSISGFKWRMKGTGNIQRSYGYSYDVAGRLTDGYYTQQDQNINPSTWINTNENYSSRNMTYDPNGNLTHLEQWGTKLGYSAPFLMDNLDYTYTDAGASNQLKKVDDNITVNYDLGEFNELGSDPSGDYQYDANGNIVTDFNKNIQSIQYNYLNKPILVTFKPNPAIRTIAYTYDAQGNRLKKIVTEGTNPPIVTDYIDGLEYVDNNLVSIPHEEGRILPTPLGEFEYEYFIKDHLNNVRSALREEINTNWFPDPLTTIPSSSAIFDPLPLAKTSNPDGSVGWHSYKVTSEPYNANIETKLFDNVDETRANKYGSTDSSDAYESRLNGSDNNKLIGPSISLRVMAGDSIRIETKAMYRTSDSNYTSTISLDEVVSALMNAMNGQGGYMSLNEGGVSTDLSNRALSNCDFLNRLQQIKNASTIVGNRPQAFLNYIFLDENLKVVPENSGLVQTTYPNEWNSLEVPTMEAKRSGYLIVFLSNESLMNVSFDNLNVMHYKGNLMEENNYYPYGLTITSNSLGATPNKSLLSTKTLEKHEFSDGTGLEWYDFDVRAYDPQIGVWHNPDPLSDLAPSWTPYRYAFSDPANYTDESGMFEGDVNDYGSINDSWEGSIEDKWTHEWTSSHDIDLTKRDGADKYAGIHEYISHSDDGGEGIMQEEITSFSEHVKDEAIKYFSDNGATVCTDDNYAIEPPNDEPPPSEWAPAIETATLTGLGAGWEFPPIEVGIAVGGAILIGGALIHDNWDQITSSMNDAIDFMKGERGRTGRSDGTDNPWKGTKPHPTKPDRIMPKQDPNGKVPKDGKPMPPGWKEWWNDLHPDKTID